MIVVFFLGVRYPVRGVGSLGTRLITKESLSHKQPTEQTYLNTDNSMVSRDEESRIDSIRPNRPLSRVRNLSNSSRSMSNIQLPPLDSRANSEDKQM
jgi:hypothetical protein